MDVKAAFPSTNSRCLVRRLRGGGVSECLARWVEDFMSHRSVRMVISGEEQSPIPVCPTVQSWESLWVLKIVVP